MPRGENGYANLVVEVIKGQICDSAISKTIIYDKCHKECIKNDAFFAQYGSTIIWHFLGQISIKLLNLCHLKVHIQMVQN